MPTIKTTKAKIVKGRPTCPQCGYAYRSGEMYDCGVDEGKGYWFVFECPVCSCVPKVGRNGKKLKTKKPKLLVKYYSDKEFNLVQRRGG